jgi:cation-transporting P-type ATPase E
MSKDTRQAAAGAAPAGSGTAAGDASSPAAASSAAAVSTPPSGLSEAEAKKRRAAGQGNVIPRGGGRTYSQIVRENIFSFINNVLFTLGVLLVILGRYLDALITVGVVALNALVSLAQEIRAKIKLDRIAILTRPKATVIRDGKEREIDPSNIVLGDLLVLHSGDQVVVDGRCTGSEHLQLD